MGTNRTPRVRTWQPGLITPEALGLFRKLDAVPEDERGDGWRKDSRQLAVLLGPMGVGGEDYESAWFLGGIDVCDPRLDRNRPGYWGGAPLARVREMREQLLAAITVH
jgi:hypothetical protein